MTSLDLLRRGLAAAMLCAALLVPLGCRDNSTIRIVQPPTSISQEDAQSILQRLVAYRDEIKTFQGYLEGRIVWQSKLAEFKLPKADAAAEDTATARISKAYILARREAGEQRYTMLVSTFARFRAVIEMLAIDDLWWLRKFQPERRFITGMLDAIGPRPAEWTTIRPQDIGTLLFYDDLYPEEEGQKQTFYLETWPEIYILHVLRVDRAPEPIYSRIWIERDTLNVFSHQLFDADGALVAEARFSEYKDVPTTPHRAWRAGSGDRKTLRMPGKMLLYWPRDRFAFDVLLKNIQLNGEIKEENLRVPDEKNGAHILNIDQPK